MGGDPNGSPLVFLTSLIFFRKSNSSYSGGDNMIFWKIREVYLEEDEYVIIYQ